MNEKYVIDASLKVSDQSNKIENKYSFKSKSVNPNSKETKFYTGIIEDIENENISLMKDKSFNDKKIKNLEITKHNKNVELDNKNKQNWEEIIVRKNQFSMDQEVKNMKTSNLYKQLVSDSLKQSQKENEIQLDLFEKNLSRLGLDITALDPKLKKSNKPSMTSEMIIQKYKDNMAADKLAKKELNARKRKKNFDQNKAQFELDKIKEENINQNKEIELTKSNYDRRSDYENWRILHNRNEIVEQRKILKEEKLKEIYFRNSVSKYKNNQFNKIEFFEYLHQTDLKQRTKELEIKKQKRKKTLSLINPLIDSLFDLTEEVYKLQNTNNIELLNIKEWKILAQDFIDNNLKSKQSNLDDKNLTFISNKTFASGQDYSEFKFDIKEDCELFDYLHYFGQWKKDLIPLKTNTNILDINDVVSSDFFSKSIGLVNRNNNYRRNFDYELKDEDIENLTVPKEPNKNYALGEIIDIIIDIKFPKTQIKENNILEHIPLKLSIIGHKFSGKKTQGKLITEGTPFKIYNLNELIKKNLEILEKLETPLEANPKFKTLKKNQIEQLQQERAQEELKFQELKPILISLRDSKSSNEQYDDNLLIDLLLTQINIDFPLKTKDQIIQELLNKNKRKKELSDELAKIKEEQSKKPKTKLKEEQHFLSELAKLNNDTSKGFVVINFPTTLKQAKLLEFKITGYIQEIDKAKSENEKYKNKFSIILEKQTREKIASELKQSALNATILLDVPSKECIRRCIHRRIDPNNGNIYHLEDYPPPSNDHKLIDRLQCIDDVQYKEDSLAIKHFEQDKLFSELEWYYQTLGNVGFNFPNFNKIDGVSNKELIKENINQIVTKIAKFNEEKENSYLEESQKNRDPLVTIIKATSSQSNLSLLEVNEKQINTSQIQIPDEDDFNKYMRRFQEAKKKIPFNTIDRIFNNWNSLFEGYANESKNIFKFINSQKENVSNYFNKLQIQFISFLKRPSNVLNEVHRYQAKYNQFYDEHPQLLNEQEVREQFKSDITEVGERLWKNIEVRKDEAIAERKLLMESGWFETEMDKLYNQIERLFIIETDLFLGSLGIIKEFYSSLDNKLIPEFNSFKGTEILKEDELNSLPLENKIKGTYPKIEKLYKNCFRILFRYDEKVKSLDKVLKNSVNFNISSDSLSKKASRTINIKKNADSYDDRREIFLYDEELRLAIKSEKTKYKYRITLLKFWGIHHLSMLRKVTSSMFDKLDDWIISGVKNENDNLNDVINALKAALASNRKIKNSDVEVEKYKVYCTVDLMEILETSTSALIYEDQLNEGKFNASSFYNMFLDLKSLEIQSGYIKISSFINNYLKNYLVDSKFDGIPQSIIRLSYHNFKKLLNLFEVNTTNNNINLENNNTSIQPK